MKKRKLSTVKVNKKDLEGFIERVNSMMDIFLENAVGPARSHLNIGFTGIRHYRDKLQAQAGSDE